MTISLHALAWAIFFTFPFLLRPFRMGQHLQDDLSGFIYLVSCNNIIRMVVFYTNYNVLIPKLMYRRKYWQYFGILVLIFAFMFAADRLLFSMFLGTLQYRMINFLAFNLPAFIFLIIASAALRGVRDQIRENNRIKELENENLKTELSLLRSQVSPHFMFNVLNNMVALARKKSDALEPSLIKLSQLLRYMLYETGEHKVMLQNEVEYLRSYIDLQQQRFGKNVQVNTSFADVSNGYPIEPMLLIPFVENAFKHGTGLIENAQIDIDLQMQHDVLVFSVKNKFNDSANEPKDKTSGIGLANVKRRLNLLYRNRHKLDISRADGWFNVLLELKLH